jgi:hypothetical protein
MGASLYFGAAAVGGGSAVGSRTGAAVVGAAVAGAAVAGATVGVAAGVQAERTVDRIRIQADAIVRVVFVLEGFICILLLIEIWFILGKQNSLHNGPSNQCAQAIN